MRPARPPARPSVASPSAPGAARTQDRGPAEGEPERDREPGVDAGRSEPEYRVSPIATGIVSDREHSEHHGPDGL